MTKNGQRSGLAALVLMAMAITGQADNTTLQVRSVSRNIPERGQVEAMQVTVGKERASFIMPTGWRIGSDQSGVVIQAGDFSATVTLRVNSETKPAPASTPQNTRVNQEFTCPTGLGQASVVDAQVAADQDLRLQTRTICIAQAGQVLQFDLKAKPADFAKHQRTLEMMVASLRKE
jgi:hypothetical protein